jgi:hypothetical protein
MSWFGKRNPWEDVGLEDQQEIQLAYQRVFDPANPDAMLVLSHMLAKLRHFAELETEEDLHLHNFSKRLMHWTGLWKRGKSLQIVQAYMQKARAGGLD